jgi:hypothetical protein
MSLIGSLAEFYAMLDSAQFPGASRVVDVQELKVLIARYPEHARYYLAYQDQVAQAGDPPTPRAPNEESIARQEVGDMPPTGSKWGVQTGRGRASGTHRRR